MCADLIAKGPMKWKWDFKSQAAHALLCSSVNCAFPYHICIFHVYFQTTFPWIKLLVKLCSKHFFPLYPTYFPVCEPNSTSSMPVLNLLIFFYIHCMTAVQKDFQSRHTKVIEEQIFIFTFEWAISPYFLSCSLLVP